MFSQESVHHSVHRGGPHVTITHDALDLVLWSSLFKSVYLRTPFLGATSDGGY